MSDDKLHLIPDTVLDRLEMLSARCDPGPWTASVEGRDHESGDDFIITGTEGDRGEDIYVTRDSGPASAACLDLIAEARTYLPALIAELRERRSESQVN